MMIYLCGFRPAWAAERKQRKPCSIFTTIRWSRAMDNMIFASTPERDAFIPHSVRIMRIHSVKMQGNGKNIRGNQRFELR